MSNLSYPTPLITFEGIDLCGKSVQIKRLEEKLFTRNIPYLLLREPGGTIFSEKIREVLLTKENETMNPVTEFLLFSAARAQIVRQKILPALEKGLVVICDRYFDSSTAYQGYGRGIDLNMIDKINEFATETIKPNLSFLIDIDLDEMEKRKKLQESELDRMEDQAKEFFEKVRNGYLTIANKEQERFVVIDGKNTIDAIADEIWERVEGFVK
ncbi:dTMP kinase [candidate division KSB1 bacterium]|nr:dTMP kinase [candidate division KSB1 bacterium]